MPVLVNLGFHELNVRSIKPIPEGQPTKACVKSEISIGLSKQQGRIEKELDNYFKWW